jgi:type I restriction enzyme S subunit
MEVKPGYKQTEVGVIPEEWEVRNLSDVSRKITDGDHVTPMRTSQGYYLLSARNVLNGRIDVSDVDYVGFAEYQRMRQRCGPEAGDILISCSGTIGRVTVVPVGFECVLVRSAALAKIAPQLADGVFLQFWLQGSKAQWQIASSVNQGAQPNLFLNHIERLLCPRPPLPEQRAIATALSDVDRLLGGLDRIIAKKRDLKQAAMQQLLTGKTRLPGFHGEWEVKRLGDVVKIKKGQLITSSTLKQGDIPVIAGGKQPAYFHAFANRFGRTVTISASGASAGYVALYSESIFASDCSTISESESYCLDFVFFQLLCKQQTIYKAQTGGAQPHIHAKDLNPILFSLPPLPEQTAIAEVLTNMDAELVALEQRRDKTRALKQAMMQELLTGRTRLV